MLCVRIHLYVIQSASERITKKCMSLRASYDGFTYITDDPAFQTDINQGRAEPYTEHGSIVKRYLSLFPHRNRTYVDVGAHIGTMLLPYSRLFHKCEGFESHPTNYQHCVENIRNSGATNCRVHQFAVMDRETRGKMLPHSGGNSGCYYFAQDPMGDVASVRLDDMNIVQVDFIKVDTEGSELMVLQGAEQLLRRDQPLVQVETNGWSDAIFGITARQLHEFMLSLGYVLFDTSLAANPFYYCPDHN